MSNKPNYICVFLKAKILDIVILVFKTTIIININNDLSIYIHYFIYHLQKKRILFIKNVFHS